MTLSNHIQSQIDTDLEQLQTELKEKFRSTKAIWDKKLNSISKIHHQEIEQSVLTQVNVKTFQAKKLSGFESDAALHTQLDTIYLDLLPDILTSPYVTQLIRDILDTIDTDTTLTISGTYHKILQSILSDLGYHHIDIQEDTQSLGLITAKLPHGHLEISLQDILTKVKQYTLPKIIESL